MFPDEPQISQENLASSGTYQFRASRGPALESMFLMSHPGAFDAQLGYWYLTSTLTPLPAM